MSEHLKFQLEPDDQERLNRLCGPTNSTLKQIEEVLCIKISNRGMKFKVRGETEVIKTAEFLLKDLYERLEKNIIMSPEEIDLYLRQVINNKTNIESLAELNRNTVNVIKTPKIWVNPKGLNQEKYLEFIEKKTLTIGIGPAGTGKTYLAVAIAVQELISGKVEKLSFLKISWNPRQCHGNSRNFMKIRESPWNFMGFHESEQQDYAMNSQCFASHFLFVLPCGYSIRRRWRRIMVSRVFGTTPNCCISGCQVRELSSFRVPLR